MQRLLIKNLIKNRQQLFFFLEKVFVKLKTRPCILRWVFFPSFFSDARIFVCVDDGSLVLFLRRNFFDWYFYLFFFYMLNFNELQRGFDLTRPDLSDSSACCLWQLHVARCRSTRLPVTHSDSKLGLFFLFVFFFKRSSLREPCYLISSTSGILS